VDESRRLFSDAWNVIVDIAKVVVLVLGIVVLIVGGPLAWVVLAAGIVLLIDALLEYSRGEGSPGDVGWALLGCIPGTRGLTTLGGLAKGLRALRANPAAFARGFLASGRALLGRMAADVRAGRTYVTTVGRSLLPHGAAVTPDGHMVMMTGDNLGDAHRAGREAFDAARAGEVPPSPSSTLDPELLGELAESGVKHNPSDIAGITRDPSGRVVFLERGNPASGLEHILQRHAGEFEQAGIPVSDVPSFLTEAVGRGTVVGTQRGTPILEVQFAGKTHRVAVTVGDNGYIVSANMRSPR
jgi:hypothetical protein